MSLEALSSIAPTAAPMRHRRSVHRWRRVQAFGGFVLACTFFLPAVQSCNSPVSPAEAMLELAQDLPTEPLDWLMLPMALAMYLSAYFFGLLVALTLALRRPELNTAPGRLDRVASGVAPLTALAILLCLASVFVERSWAGLAALREPAVLIAAWTLPFWWRCRRRGGGGAIAMRWYTASCCLLWFGWWTWQGALFGLHLSLGASVLMVVGTFEEARLRAHRSRLRVLAALITGTLELHDADPSRCARCGYALQGLTTPRCPECGTAFDPHRLHNADMAVG